MAQVYSTYEAKARFSEILRKVRNGQRVIIAYRGKEVAEVSPIRKVPLNLAETLGRLEEQGIVDRRARPTSPLRPLAKRPGALARFLESRE